MRHTAAWIASGLVLLGVFAGCTGDPAGEPGEHLGTTAAPLKAWARGAFRQILRVNVGETTVRNKCRLIVPVSAAKPLTFIASASPGGSEEVGWYGLAVSSGRLSISGCAAYPCEVVAEYHGVAADGVEQACQITVDDGTQALLGASSGNTLKLDAAPSATVIFNQEVKNDPAGTSFAGRCILRQSADLVDASVSDFSIDVDGKPVFTLLSDGGSFPIGADPWPTKTKISFGTLVTGHESGATRLKHVTPRKAKLASGSELRCSGRFDPQDKTAGFEVNLGVTPTGYGMSLTDAPTGWICDPAYFGTGNGCDCKCGITDPGCAATGTGCTANGDPCGASDECQSGLCITEQDTGWPGGNCAEDCSKTSCPAGFECMTLSVGDVCIQRCSSEANCDQGESCMDHLGTSRPVCWPDCNVDADCPQTGSCNEYVGSCIADQGLSKDGGPCLADSDCESGICLEQSGSIWPGGYCVSLCTLAEGLCPSDGICLDYAITPRIGYCMDTCIDNSDCRTPWYTCQAIPFKMCYF